MQGCSVCYCKDSGEILQLLHIAKTTQNDKKRYKSTKTLARHVLLRYHRLTQQKVSIFWKN